MIVLEREDPDVLNGDYKLRTDAIKKCALAALKIGYIVFAVHDGGSCLASPGTYNPIFNKFGISKDCKSDGRGASRAHHVYVTGGIQGMLLSNYEYMWTVTLEFLSYLRTRSKDLLDAALNETYVRLKKCPC